MTVVEVPLSWLPQLLHSCRGFNQSSSVERLRHELHHKKVPTSPHQWKEPRAPGLHGDIEIADTYWVKWIPPQGFAQLPADRHQVPLRCSRVLLTGLRRPLRKECVISGLYTIPSRPLRTIRMSLGTLTGSRTYAWASDGNPGIFFFWTKCLSWKTCSNWPLGLMHGDQESFHNLW